jgi:hypothetical protein
MRYLSIFLLVIMLTGVRFAEAQDDIPPAAIRIPVSAGLNFTVAQPAGEFGDYIDQGFGLEANVSIPFDSRGILSARLEGGFTNYGNEKVRVPLSPTMGNLIMVDVTTSNNIFTFGLGPQLTFPEGPVRPYAVATIGGSYFATQSRVEGTDNINPFAETTNFDDFVFTMTGGGGVLIPLGWHQNTRFMLDLGTSYHHNGPTRYLREGSLSDIQDGNPDLVAVESRASYFNFRVGLVIRTF